MTAPAMPAPLQQLKLSPPQAQLIRSIPSSRRHKQQQRRAHRCAAEPGSSDEQGSSGVPDTLPLAGVDTDWREFRARLVAGSRKPSEAAQSSQDADSARPAVDNGYWAHEVPRPERGCLLIAHPLMFVQTQTYFAQSVIFILEHNEQGSHGLILNRSTNLKLGKVTGADPLCPEFEDCTLFLGGDVGSATLQMLHGQHHLEGAQRVIQGISIGGFPAAKSAVARGQLDPLSVRWFTRYSGWGPGQLERECQNGVWMTAAGGPSLILQPGLEGTAGDALWHSTLQLMGGQYADLSAALKTQYSGYRPDIMGKEPEASSGSPPQDGSDTAGPDQSSEQSRGDRQ